MMRQLVYFYFVRIVFIWVLVFSLARGSWADSAEDEIKGLIQSYAGAVETEDLNLVRAAWEDLSRNQDAVDYMRHNMPKLHYLFQVRGLYFQMDNLDERRKKLPVDAQTSDSAAAKIPSQFEPGALGDAQPAELFSVSEEEADRLPTNGEIVARSQNQARLDNRQIALANPNQNRIDNAALVQSRTDAFYEQKFQKAPRVLVPQAQDLAYSAAEENATVKVRGLSVAVTLSQDSKKSVRVKVSINGRAVAGDLELAEHPIPLTVYLEPGINELGISVERASIAVHSIAVSMALTEEGPKRLSWGMKAGDRQTFRIEARP